MQEMREASVSEAGVEGQDGCHRLHEGWPCACAEEIQGRCDPDEHQASHGIEFQPASVAHVT